MRLALITDIHYGIRNDRIEFLDAHKRFLDNVFFPYLEENGINRIICLGDLLDRRKFVNFYTAKRLRNDFIEPIIERCADHFYWILGNHDIYYKHSLEVSPAYELARDYHIHVIDKPICIDFDGVSILMVPWITDQNREACYAAIKNSEASICMGHFEIQGFQTFKGVYSHVGDDRQLFEGFDRVFSGHFHHRHSDNNIDYLGAMGDYSWADYGDSRGFHVFDTDNKELTFIENPYKMFAKVFYDDSGEHSVIPPGGFEHLQGKIVKLIILKQTSADQFDWFMNQLEAAKTLEIQTVHENFTQAFPTDIPGELSEKDTLTVIRDCIKFANNAVNYDKLDRLFVDLYREAQDAE